MRSSDVVLVERNGHTGKVMGGEKKVRGSLREPTLSVIGRISSEEKYGAAGACWGRGRTKRL